MICLFHSASVIRGSFEITEGLQLEANSSHYEAEDLASLWEFLMKGILQFYQFYPF